MRDRRARWIRFAAFIAVLALCIAHAWARAGGGEGFHGGGGGGGHGGGGGGGGGRDITFLIELIIWLIFHPVIGVPVLAVVVLVLYFSNNQGVSMYQSGVIRRAAPLIAESQKQAVVAQLKQHDPAFDENAFLQRVGTAFTKIQTAWCAQNLKDVGLFLSDGVAERFSLQFAEQKAFGYRDQMDNIGIDDLRIADLNTSGIFDEISVRITAHASDQHVPLPVNTPGQTASPPPIAPGFGGVQSFTEIWSFLRRRGTVTDVTKPGLIEGNCPNCGASIEMNQNAQCPYCQALLHSGQYDWVLSEITQESEWQRSGDQSVPGLEPFRQKDPSFDPQALEDRASVIFWRRASADRIGKLDPVRKVATEEFCESIKAAVAGVSGQPREYAGDCAVGGVELLGMSLASADDAMDQAVVRVRWSGKQHVVDPNTHRINAGGNFVRTTAMVLIRKPSARTNPDRAISSAHCPNCGAPESDSASNACPNCGTVLNDGSRDWVLAQWRVANDPAVAEILNAATAADPQVNAPPTAPANAQGLLAWAIQTAMADGHIDESEQQQLAALAQQGNISTDELNTMLKAATQNQLQAAEPSSPEEAKAWVGALAKIALSDGVLDNNEWALLASMGRRAGLSEMDVKLLLKRTQADQYAAARAASRPRAV